MKVCIVGTAPSSMGLVPAGDPSWKIWACSPGTYGQVPRIDEFFELHRWEPGQPWFSEGYCNFLRNFEGPVWMSSPIPEVKNCTLLPVQDLVSKYGPYFFTSSISWMMAMAIEAGAEKIALYGVDMAAFEEYGYQRAGCQFFAMLARSKGIEVGVPPESDLLRPSALYGVCENSHQWIKTTARARELSHRRAECEQVITQKTQELQFLRGAIDDLGWVQNTWFGNTDSMTAYVEPPDVPALKNIDMTQEHYEDLVKDVVG